MTTILVIEDDPAILRGLQLSLRVERYDVVTATDGETGGSPGRENRIS